MQIMGVYKCIACALTLIRNIFIVDAGMASSQRILLLLVVLSLSLTCKARPAGLFLLSDAVEKGAVCLDGSPAGYYFRPGTGSGASKWMIYLRGGNWCFDLQSCFDRSMQTRGSTKYWPKTEQFDGILSDDKVLNPDFHNWNFIHVIYCDGMSFANFLSEPQFVGDIPVYFRGRVILKAIVEELLELGVKDASEVLLIGTSAGAESIFLNVDRVRNMIPQHIPMKAVADAGFFIDVPNRQGDWLFRNGIRQVFSNFNITAEGLDEDCANMFSDELWRCWFPANFYNQIQTPIFVVNSPYDTTQLNQILQLGCRLDQGTCDAESLLLVNKFREDWLTAARDAINSPTNGMFVYSCFRHVLLRTTDPFAQITVRGRGVRDVVGDWYFGRRENNTVIDCAFPCNPTC